MPRPYVLLAFLQRTLRSSEMAVLRMWKRGFAGKAKCLNPPPED